MQFMVRKIVYNMQRSMNLVVPPFTKEFLNILYVIIRTLHSIN